MGHMPRKISAVFLGKTGVTITGTVTGLRQYSHDLPQGGMEVMKFAGCKMMVNKAKFVLLDMKRPVPLSMSVPVRVCRAGTGGIDVNSSSSSNPSLIQ